MPLTTRRFLTVHPAAPASNPSPLSTNPPTNIRFAIPPSFPPYLANTRTQPHVLRKRVRPAFVPTAAQAAVTNVDSDRSNLMENAVIVQPISADAELDLPFSELRVDPVTSSVQAERQTTTFGAESSSATTANANRQMEVDEALPADGPTNEPSLETVEFAFLDNKNVCCGLCGEIVPYEQLMSEHLPNSHPDVYPSSNREADDDSSDEQVYQQRYLREKLFREKRFIETGFKMSAYRSAARAPKATAVRRTTEPSRKVSSIRVNPRTMSLSELEQALKKKMYEKLNRRVPVTLMDKIHARCGMCNAIISLNKKFEIVHLVRHFNCWHPTVHSCAGSWQNRQPARRGVKLLSIHDFAVVDTGSGSPDSLQCIWCGMFVESQGLAQHFGELHSDDVEVPKCNLCLQELILTARFHEKFGIEIQITLPDEHHMKCNKCGTMFSNEVSLDNHVQRRHVAGISADDDPQADEDDINLEEIGPEAFANSRMTLGKRRRPKRQFIMPALRQSVPLDSEYVEPIAECHWKCKICEGNIYGAVISAAAIRHYKFRHPEHADNMQYDTCKSRLEKISDGCMEFVHPQLIECLLCQQSFNLHQPFNMCRAIRHLKCKHPNLMPEYAGLTQLEEFDEEEDGAGPSTIIRRQPIAQTLVAAEAPTMVFAQQNLLPRALTGVATAQTFVYTTQMAQATTEEEEDEEGEEIIVAAGRDGRIGFDTDSTSTYPQQYVAVSGNTPMAYHASASELNTPISFNSGIRVFRTPQQLRYDDHSSYHTYVDSSAAAKNARLDHGAIVRQLPDVQPVPTQVAILDTRLLEQPTTVVFQTPQQVQPRQLYLLLQTNAVESPGPSQQSLLDSPMVAGPLVHDRSLDRRSAMNVMDESMIEAQRLNELMSQAHSALASAAENDHGQPQVLMAGDEPMV